MAGQPSQTWVVGKKTSSSELSQVGKNNIYTLCTGVVHGQDKDYTVDIGHLTRARPSLAGLGAGVCEQGSGRVQNPLTVPATGSPCPSSHPPTQQFKNTSVYIILFSQVTLYNHRSFFKSNNLLKDISISLSFLYKYLL